MSVRGETGGNGKGGTGELVLEGSSIVVSIDGWGMGDEGWGNDIFDGGGGGPATVLYL